MSISYVNRKCDCGGKLQYDKLRKVWVCLYCGSEIEREEKYDGMFTIKNVVRQTILDVAYRRLESAEKNLVECEKIDSKYIGTIMANLCFLIIKATMMEGGSSKDISPTIAKIKRYSEILKSEYEEITEEEEILYEFFDASDIYATLILVYEALNDDKRVNYTFNLLKVDDIFSSDANKNLLFYLFRHKNLKLIDEIVSNNVNIEKKFLLSEILMKYPDGESKKKNIDKMIERKIFTKENKLELEKYLNDTEDSVATKCEVIRAIAFFDIKLDIDIVLTKVLAECREVSIVKDVLEKVCNVKLTDEEVYKIIEYAFSNNNEEIALAVLLVLKNSSQYVVMSDKNINVLLCRKNLPGDAKLRILKEAYEFNIDNKSGEVIINNYLLTGEDEVELRMKIVKFLLQCIKAIPVSVFEKYVLNCRVDKSNKSKIVEIILDMDASTGVYSNLLSKYIFVDIDDSNTKAEIINLFLNKGIRMETKAFINYICNGKDEATIKIDFIRKMINNGRVLNSNVLSSYLEGIREAKDFNSELFAALRSDSYIVTDKALTNYLLYCKDVESEKVRNSIEMSKVGVSQFGSQNCSINHMGNSIRCNLLQAYILLSPDGVYVTESIVKEMVNAKTKMTLDIVISGHGEKRFKKYIIENRDSLSLQSQKICEEYKLFSKFF